MGKARGAALRGWGGLINTETRGGGGFTENGGAGVQEDPGAMSP